MIIKIREKDFTQQEVKSPTKLVMFMKSQHEQVGYGQKKAVKKSVGTRENLILCSNLNSDCRVSLSAELN